MEDIAANGLWPRSRGTSRIANLPCHREPIADVAIAAMGWIAAEFWKSRDPVPGCLPRCGVNGGMIHGWIVAAEFHQGWKQAEGPWHIARLEANRAGFEVHANMRLIGGRVVLHVFHRSPALIKLHMARGFCEEQEASARRSRIRRDPHGSVPGRTPGAEVGQA